MLVDRNHAAVLAPSDDAGAAHELNARELIQRHPFAGLCRDENAADGARIRTRRRDVADGDVESPLAVKVRARRMSANRELDDVLHVTDVEAVARNGLAIDANPQLRLVFFLFDARISGAGYGF
jgi:hypothetical protein